MPAYPSFRIEKDNNGNYPFENYSRKEHTAKQKGYVHAESTVLERVLGNVRHREGRIQPSRFTPKGDRTPRVDRLK